jgi:hypothetical protein
LGPASGRRRGSGTTRPRTAPRAARRQRPRLGCHDRQPRALAEQLVDPADAGAGALQQLHLLRDLLDRRLQHDEVLEHHVRRAEGDRPASTSWMLDPIVTSIPTTNRP